jgi:hypothetical protein
MVFRTWFSGLGISTLGPVFSHSRFPRSKPENFKDVIFRMWDLNFGTWISHRRFTLAFGHGHPLVSYKEQVIKISKYSLCT